MKIGRGMSARAVIGLSLLVPAFTLTGCFATQQDLDPMRSDIMVLEKQFTEVQRQVAKARYSEEGQTSRGQMKEELSEINRRLAALEERMGRVEGQMRELQNASTAPPAAPQPIPSEPGAEAAPGQSAGPGAEAPQAPQPTKNMVASGDAFNAAMAAYSSGDYDKAESQFNAFLQSYPDDTLSDDAMFMLGEIDFARKDYKGAINEYQKVVDQFPLADRVPDALYKMGVAYELLGKTDKAKDSFTRVMDNYPYSEGAKEAGKELGKLKSQ